ncbi:S8 family serine peptidase [Isoptericola sp. NPDC057559]|uniref:S8 family serine peptidase n=1 Tax=Isoptericola sp. NPDC057559 TaxID=3346168 RepID=UPI0036B6D499
MTSPSRASRRLLASAASFTVALGILGGTGAAAAPPDDSRDALLGSTDAPGSATVTLITGDRAVVTFGAKGAPSAVLQTDEPYLTWTDGEALYVVPRAVQPLVDDGTLDRALFDVAGLVAAGYDDAARDDIPLIVEGAVPRTRGVADGRELTSIGATATTVAKESGDDLVAQLLRARDGGDRRIWLDAPVEGFGLNPGTGVEQTGAPDAWTAGFTGKGSTVAVLDTGADLSHPDLADRVVLTRDFTGEGTDATDVADREGHGTHVASTVAGTGAADGGASRGMAPDADLLVGKVLGRTGGQSSWIIAGMEWAVQQDADVVNMSLGSSQPTDCTDPIAQSLESLSDEAVFVVAAGNDGARESVSSPGCSEGALTVGAVDASSELAYFSSRGPTSVGHAIKPDLTAPGVDIRGAAYDSWGDISYTTMSGTSMATPHVAGAAALLRQAHPAWSPDRIRSALTSGVKPDADGTAYESGAGELDVAGSIDAPVLATTGQELAGFAWPHHGRERATGHVSYTNVTRKPITLSFSVAERYGADGRKVPADLFRLGVRRATIAPKQTLRVPVTVSDQDRGLDPASYGGISARITATSRGEVVATSTVGYWLEPESADLTVNVLDRDGKPATWGSVTLFQLDRSTAAAPAVDGQPITERLLTGRVSVNALVRTDSTSEWSYLSIPELVLDGDRTVTLDARDAEPVTVRTDAPSVAGSASMSYARTTADSWYVGATAYARTNGDDPVRMSALPTSGRVTSGEAGFGTYWRLFEPGVPRAESDYVYNVAFDEQGGVAEDQRHRVRDSRLAAVEETWWAQRVGHTFLDSVHTTDPLTGELRYAGSGGDDVAAPGTRVAWYQAGRPWRQSASSRVFFTEAIYGAERTYSPGERTATDWYRGLSATAMARTVDGGVARVAERQANLVGMAFPHWKDSEGRVGDGGFGDVGNAELFVDGTSLGRRAFPSGQWEVPAEEGRYEAVINQFSFQPPAFWELGRQSWTKFGFRSARPDAAGEEVDALPIMLPVYDAEVDGLQLAPATAGYPVGIDFLGQEGHDLADVTDVRVQVSYDEAMTSAGAYPGDRYTWTDVPVEERGGRWVATVDNTPAAGGQVSLHVTATAEDRTSVEQYAMHVYLVE